MKGTFSLYNGKTKFGLHSVEIVYTENGEYCFCEILLSETHIQEILFNYKNSLSSSSQSYFGGGWVIILPKSNLKELAKVFVAD
jgi:hypothetical protein